MYDLNHAIKNRREVCVEPEKARAMANVPLQPAENLDCVFYT
jgi:hypothetical protein